MTSKDLQTIFSPGKSSVNMAKWVEETPNPNHGGKYYLQGQGLSLLLTLSFCRTKFSYTADRGAKLIPYMVLTKGVVFGCEV